MNIRLPLAVALAVTLVLCTRPAALTAQQNGALETATPITSDVRALTIQRAAGPIQIDAETGDAGWAGATRITGFVELTPREGAAPPVETDVLLTYDEANLYVAFIARDPTPQEIRATLQPRDRLWQDDWVGVLLDPYGDASLGYYFLSNPIGVQADLQMTPTSEDASIDFIYTTAGRITEDGYIIEMAIPFRSLRVPDRTVQSWGIMLVRTFPRSSRHYLTWPSMSRNNPCQLCQVARLDGIEAIRTGGNLELLPAVVASQAGRLRNSSDPGSFEQGRVSAEPSLGLKYSFQRGWMAEATLNPDFSQVESDAAQVDVNTTFALFYPERRPFFQEGMDLYRTPLDVFYSRSVNSPQAATKLTGRAGRTSIGYIGARDEHTPFVIPFEERTGIVQAGRSFTNVLRVRQNLGGSHVGALLTDRRLDGGGSGTTVSADGQYRFGEMYNISGHLVVSHTREPDDAELSAQLPTLTFGEGGRQYTAAFDGESYTGHAGFLRVARDARTWSWNVLYLGTSPTYRSDAGFQTQNNYHRATGWTGLTFYPNRPFLERISASLFGGSYWNFQGARIQDVFAPGVSATLPRQTSIGINTTFREETFRGVHLTGIREYGLWLNSNFSDALGAGFQLGTGRRVARTLAAPEVGTGRDASVWATIKPLQRVVIEPSLSYAQLRLLSGDELFSGYIARTRFNLQYNRELNFRLVVQYNDFGDRLDVEPLLVYQLNPFSIFYVGSTHGSSQFDELGFVGTDRQYFAKFQYLFRR
ncbi:DUF5916 domain-containing protein [soil metagenome]